MSTQTELPTRILAGFEVKQARTKKNPGTPGGAAVYFDIHHLAAFGMTQKAGKTTLLEGLIVRSGRPGLAFLTKRGEAGFHNYNMVPPYYKASSDWQWLEGLVSVALNEKVNREPGMRSAIMRVSEGTKGDLGKVHAKAVKLEKESKRGFEKDVYHKLATYLSGVVADMSKFQFSETLTLGSGINVMDLTSMEEYPEIQQIVIAASLRLVHEKMSGIIGVVPEAWEQLPQGRMTPVKWAAERFVRKGATIGNFLWVDSQDIGGIDKTPLRQVDNWFFGRMKEAHEVERITKQLLNIDIQASVIQTLPLGHFLAVVGTKVVLMYALPAGVPPEIGKAVAMGKMTAEAVREKYLKRPPVQASRPNPVPQQTEMQKLLARLEKVEGKLATPATVERTEEMKALLEKLEKNRPPVSQTGGDILEMVETIKLVDELKTVPPVPPAPAEPENSIGEEPKVLEVHEPIQVVGIKDPKLKIVVETTGLQGQIGQAILEGLIQPEKRLRLGDLQAMLLKEFGAQYGSDDVMSEMKKLVAPPYRMFTREIDGQRRNFFVLRDRAKEQVVKA